MQDIASTIQSGSQAGGQDQIKPSSELVTELMNAHAFKKTGDTTSQEASLLRAEMAARGDVLKEQKKGMEAQIKAQEKINELMQQLVESGQQEFLLKSYADAVQKKDVNTIRLLAPVIKELNEQAFIEGMRLIEIEESDNPQTMLSAHLNADQNVQQGIYADENRESHDRMSVEQVDRRDRILGREPTPEGRARTQNRSTREMGRGKYVSPTDVLNRDTTEKPDALKDNTTTRQRDWDGIKTDMVKRGATPEEIEKAHTNFWGYGEKEKTPTDFSTMEAVRGKYPVFTGTGENRQRNPNRLTFDRLSAGLGKDAKQTLYATLDGFFEGRDFASIPSNEKISISKDLASLAANSKAMGGDLIKRFLFSQKLLVAGMPGLRASYEKVKGTTGVWRKNAQGFMEFFGRAESPEVQAFQSRIEKITNDVIRLQSGAQINETEMARFLKMLPDIGKVQEVNEEIFSALEESIKGIFGLLYSDSLGNEWGSLAAAEAYENPSQVFRMINEVQYITREELDQIVKIAQQADPTVTRQQTIRELEQAGKFLKR